MPTQEKAKIIFNSIENLVHYDQDIPYTKEEGVEILTLASELCMIIREQEEDIIEMSDELQVIDDIIMKDHNTLESDPMVDKIIKLIINTKND